MSKKQLVSILLSVFIIVIVIVAFFLSNKEDNKVPKQNARNVMFVDSLNHIIDAQAKIIDDKSEVIKEREDQIRFLKDSLINLSILNGAVKSLKEQILKDSLYLSQKDQIIKNLSKRRVYVKLEIPKPLNTPPAPSTSSTALATQIKKNDTGDNTKVQLPISFAVLTEKGWWPDWASKIGTNFPEMVDNNQGGYNLIIRSFSPSISGRYGVTKTSIFVNANEIGSGDIKVVSNITGWQIKNMKKVTNDRGVFYIYAP